MADYLQDPAGKIWEDTMDKALQYAKEQANTENKWIEVVVQKY